MPNTSLLTIDTTSYMLIRGKGLIKLKHLQNLSCTMFQAILSKMCDPNLPLWWNTKPLVSTWLSIQDLRDPSAKEEEFKKRLTEESWETAIPRSFRGHSIGRSNAVCQSFQLHRFRARARAASKPCTKYMQQPSDRCKGILHAQLRCTRAIPTQHEPSTRTISLDGKPAQEHLHADQLRL